MNRNYRLKFSIRTSKLKSFADECRNIRGTMLLLIRSSAVHTAAKKFVLFSLSSLVFFYLKNFPRHVLFNNLSYVLSTLIFCLALTDKRTKNISRSQRVETNSRSYKHNLIKRLYTLSINFVDSRFKIKI